MIAGALDSGRAALCELDTAPPPTAEDKSIFCSPPPCSSSRTSIRCLLPASLRYLQPPMVIKNDLAFTPSRTPSPPFCADVNRFDLKNFAPRAPLVVRNLPPRANPRPRNKRCLEEYFVIPRDLGRPLPLCTLDQLYRARPLTMPLPTPLGFQPRLFCWHAARVASLIELASLLKRAVPLFEYSVSPTRTIFLLLKPRPRAPRLPPLAAFREPPRHSVRDQPAPRANREWRIPCSLARRHAATAPRLPRWRLMMTITITI